MSVKGSHLFTLDLSVLHFSVMTFVLLKKQTDVERCKMFTLVSNPGPHNTTVTQKLSLFLTFVFVEPLH